MQRAKAAMQEREVEVDRQRLIQTLEQNLTNHIKTYQEALQGYKKAAMKKLQEDGEAARAKLERNLKNVEAEIEEFDPEKPHRFSDHFVLIPQVLMTLPVPKSYEAEYRAAIDIAKWEVNATMNLTYAEFTCFVRDQWDWKQEFEQVTMAYTHG